MRVAITGAGGLLGGAVLNRVLASGYEVIALSGSLDTAPGVEVKRWDAKQDWRLTAKALRNVDAIVHAAAHIPRDHNDTLEATQCFEVNALGTLNLLKASESAGVKRLIYVSGANVMSPRSEFVQEDSPIGCEHSPYYLGSKVLGEIYVRAKIARGLDGLIVRPSTIYGPGMKTGILFHFSERIRSGKSICIQDGGGFRSDYIWREDVAKVLCEAVVGNQTGEVNLGSGQAISVLDVAKMLIKIFDVDESLIEYAPIGPQGLGVGFCPVDITRAQDWFKFHPMSLYDGLVRWFATGEA